MKQRTDLARRKPLAVQIEDVYEESTDTFAVIGAFFTSTGEYREVGGHIKNWSTFDEAAQTVIRGDLREIAEREIAAGRNAD